MADLSLQAESVSANPETLWTDACAALEKARLDCLEPASGDEEGERRGIRQSLAGDAVLLTPAPDFRAVAHKLQVFLDEEVYRCDDESVKSRVGAIIADIRRLATAKPDETLWRYACDMDRPLGKAYDLMDGLLLMAQALDDAGAAVSTIVTIARHEIDSAEELRGKLFRALHPNKAELDREGWPA